MANNIFDSLEQADAALKAAGRDYAKLGFSSATYWYNHIHAIDREEVEALLAGKVVLIEAENEYIVALKMV